MRHDNPLILAGALLVLAGGCYANRSAGAGAELSGDGATDEVDADAAVGGRGPGGGGPTAGNRGPGIIVPGDDGDGGIVLECKRGGPVAAHHVEFECSSITVYTCKDLSNVVIEFEDGTRQRFEGLNGNTNTFTGTGANAGKRVVRVWVKAGANHSGEGPGYGQRVETTTTRDDCGTPTGGRGGSGGAGGSGGSGGTPGGGGNGGAAGSCVSGPDVPCGQGGSGAVGGNPGSAGTGSGGAGGEMGPD